MKTKKIGEIMSQASQFLKMREDFLALGIIDQRSDDFLDELARAIRSHNKDDHFKLTVFLMAICSTSPKRRNLLKMRLDVRDPKLFRRLKKIGFRDSVLPLNPIAKKRSYKKRQNKV